MLILKCGFCACSEGCLSWVPWSSLVSLHFSSSSICFLSPPPYKLCFDACRTDVAFKLAHGHLSRGLWWKLIPCKLPDATSAAEIAEFSADTLFVHKKQHCNKHHLCCMRMASSLKIINVHGPYSAFEHPLCWELNMQPLAYKFRRWDREKVGEQIEVKWEHLSSNSSSVASWDPSICFSF